jgi:hypothetical protein
MLSELVNILAAKTVAQVQKLMLHRYLLNFSLGLCPLILLSDFVT